MLSIYLTLALLMLYAPFSFANGEKDLITHECGYQEQLVFNDRQNDAVYKFYTEFAKFFDNSLEPEATRLEIPSEIYDYFSYRYPKQETALKLLQAVQKELRLQGVDMTRFDRAYLPSESTPIYYWWRHVFHEANNIKEIRIFTIVALFHADFILSGAKENFLLPLHPQIRNFISDMFLEQSPAFEHANSIKALRDAFTRGTPENAAPRPDEIILGEGNLALGKFLRFKSSAEFKVVPVQQEALLNEVATYFASVTQSDAKLAKHITMQAGFRSKDDKFSNPIYDLKVLPSYEQSPTAYWKAVFAEAAKLGQTMVVSVLKVTPHIDQMPADLQARVLKLLQGNFAVSP